MPTTVFDQFLAVTNNEPVFKRASIESAASQLHAARTHTDQITLPDIYQRPCTLNAWIPPPASSPHNKAQDADDEKREGVYNWSANVLFDSYQGLAHQLSLTKDNGEQLQEGNCGLRPVLVGTSWLSQPLPPCSLDDAMRENMAAWKSEWESSALCSVLTKHLRAHRNKLHGVDKVICFGLDAPIGTPRDDENSDTYDHSRRCYIQHLSACTIARNLSALSDPPKCIQLFAQDPIYCDLCKTALAELDIQVLDNPHGFLAVDENTFVVSMAPDTCVNQIVVDLTAEVGGPTAIFCFQIKGDGVFGDEHFPEDITTTPWTTDPSSPRVWEYVKRCTKLGFEELEGEDREFLGWVLGDVQVYVKTT